MTFADVTGPAARWAEAIRRLVPGLALAGVVAIAAGAVAARYNAPVMLFALLFGMALAFLSEDARARPGLDCAATTLLKAAVALLGLTVSAGTLATLGVTALVEVALLVTGTLIAGLLLGRRLGWTREVSLVAAGAVAICGASAALALSALMPSLRARRSEVLTVVLVVTTLSTVAMALYPAVLGFLGFPDAATGFVLGATIHDVAQVVGAGYSVSDTAGEYATLVKMMRVALLPLVLLAVSVAVSGNEPGARRLRLPWFVWVFAAFFALSSGVALPPALTDTAFAGARVLLVLAMAAIGLNSNLRETLRQGRATFAVMASLSLLLFAGAVTLEYLRSV